MRLHIDTINWDCQILDNESIDELINNNKKPNWYSVNFKLGSYWFLQAMASTANESIKVAEESGIVSVICHLSIIIVLSMHELVKIII